MSKIIKNKYFILVFCLFISFMGITICSECSFLYPMNKWVDANAFFTVAKGILNGLVPYRDLFEQKGPILYFIYTIGALISHKSFIGVYFLEIISFTFALYFLAKTINIFLNKKYIFVIIPVFSTLFLTSNYFALGGSAEEFIFPLLCISFYHFIRYIDKNIIDNKILFVTGIIIGVVSLIKYTLLGFWIVFVLTILIKKLISKDYREFLFCVFYLLIGFSIPILLVMTYFILNNALLDFIDNYFIANIFLYAKKESIIYKILYMAFICYKSMINNIYILFMIIVGMGFMACKNNLFLKRLPIILSFFALLLGIYIGGKNYIYYYLDVVIYSILGLITICMLIDKYINKKIYLIVLLITLTLSIAALFKSPNYYFSKYKKEDLVQYKFASIINKKDNATLLNYRFLDGGFYFAADILPTTKFFMRQNIACKVFSDNCTFQDDVVKNGEVDFVVTRRKNNEKDFKKRLKKYRLISKEEFEGFVYELYERKK